MSKEFHIKAPKGVIDRIVKIAHRYTDQETGAPAYLKSILLEANDDGLLTVTSESQYSAIKIEHQEDIEVLVPGQLMVQANWLVTALDTVQPDESVEIFYDKDGKDHRIHLNNVDMLPPITGERALLPSVGEPDLDNGIKMAPEEFVDTYLTASVGRSSQASKPILQGVFAETSVEDGLFRMMSFDALISVTDAVEAEILGEGAGGMIFKDDSVRASLDHIKQGNSVQIHRDKDDRVHVLVKGKEDAMPYHIRVATLDYPIEKYPSAKVRQSLSKFPAQIGFHASVDKAELLRIMRNSANIGSLDINNIGGQAKYVQVAIQDNELTSSVLTDASYEESIPVDIVDADNPDIQFKFPYGTSGHLFEWYHNQNDPQNIQMAFLIKEGAEDPHGIILYKDSIYKDESNEELSEYFCVTSVSRVKR